MKIAYLSSSQIPSKTANSVHVMKMCHGFAKNNHDITLYAKDNSHNFIGVDSYHFYGVTDKFSLKRIRSFNVRGLGSILYSLKLLLIINKDKPELFYGRDILSLILASVFGKDLIFEAHSLPTNGVRKKVESALFKLKEFKRLIVISEALKVDYLNEFPSLTKDKILVAHDAADIPKNFDKNSNQISKSKDRRINIGYVGHLYPGRGIDIIVELAKRMSDINFCIIGGLEEDVNIWKEKTRNLDNILFHGFIPNGELSDYYSEIDILLAPYQKKVLVTNGDRDTSRWMSPMKIFEYMSYCKPIISSDIKVLREVLINEKNCILCKPDSVEEWERAIRKLLNDSEYMNSLAKRAHLDFLENYTWFGRAKKVLSNFD